MYRQNGGQFDASVQCTIPNEWKKIAPHDVGYTAGIETDEVAGEWITKGNEVDKLLPFRNIVWMSTKTLLIKQQTHLLEKIFQTIDVQQT